MVLLKDSIVERPQPPDRVAPPWAPSARIVSEACDVPDSGCVVPRRPNFRRHGPPARAERLGSNLTSWPRSSSSAQPPPGVGGPAGNVRRGKPRSGVRPRRGARLFGTATPEDVTQATKRASGTRQLAADRRVNRRRETSATSGLLMGGETAQCGGISRRHWERSGNE